MRPLPQSVQGRLLNGHLDGFTRFPFSYTPPPEKSQLPCSGARARRYPPECPHMPFRPNLSHTSWPVGLRMEVSA